MVSCARGVCFVCVCVCVCVCVIVSVGLSQTPTRTKVGRQTDREVFAVERIICMFRISSLQGREHIAWALLSERSYLCPASVLCSDEYDIWLSVAF